MAISRWEGSAEQFHVALKGQNWHTSSLTPSNGAFQVLDLENVFARHPGSLLSIQPSEMSHVCLSLSPDSVTT
jgi:hypothetical protein